MAEAKCHEIYLGNGGLRSFTFAHEARQRGTALFRDSVKAYLTAEFQAIGGWHSVEVERPDYRDQLDTGSPVARCSGASRRKTQARRIRGSRHTIETVLERQTDDVNIMYNLGMALSDMGQLAEAQDHLRTRRHIWLADFTNARIALGVALQRQGNNTEAIAVLNEAVRRDPENPWAQRNLGACLFKAGRSEEAEEHLRQAVMLAPRDQAAMFGLAEVLVALGRTKDAHDAYKKVIDLDEYSKIAEAAQDALRKMAEQSFKSVTPGMPRPDAVMYCLGALEKFAKMARAEVQQIAFEIAATGQRGLDTNDPTPKYQLKSLAGNFSGLHLVCLMYVAFKSIAAGYGHRIRPFQGIRRRTNTLRKEHRALNYSTTRVIRRGESAGSDFYFMTILRRMRISVALPFTRKRSTNGSKEFIAAGQSNAGSDQGNFFSKYRNAL